MSEFIDPESEHGAIVSGAVRDFTRRYGMLKVPSSIPGLIETDTGFWKPVVEDGTIGSIIFHGLVKVETPELSPKES